MTDILALQQVLPIVTFGPSSRYAGIATAKMVLDGETVVFLRRRFLPPPESLAVIGVHLVTQDERLDHVAARYLGDPEQFWRIADANRALRPQDLMNAIGRRLVITLPEGVAGIPNA